MQKVNRTPEEIGSSPREEESRLKTQKKINSETTNGDRELEERGSAPREEEVKQKNLLKDTKS
ncbi:MAG: hypothetical protein MRJ93_03585 [Nitrososphaeraceae archaeon]|nr:hypothetical protein [Nitrososphaeraceae archaeon]